MDNWEGTRDRLDSLYVRQIGHQICEPLHQYGPAVRDHVLLHFVASGSGTLYAKGQVLRIERGQGFAIFPDQITTYRADLDDPWHYHWVGYAGFDAEPLSRQAGLVRDEPVFDFGDVGRAVALIEQMHRDAANLRLGAMAALGGLYQLLALIGEGAGPSDVSAARSYCERAIWYMVGNYGLAITIEDVANYVGLSRSQLFRVFQRERGLSPKACLTQIRVRRALELLESTDLPLDQVAASVGISSAARLNALLREAVHMSAGRYRRERRT